MDKFNIIYSIKVIFQNQTNKLRAEKAAAVEVNSEVTTEVETTTKICITRQVVEHTSAAASEKKRQKRFFYMRFYFKMKNLRKKPPLIIKGQLEK